MSLRGALKSSFISLYFSIYLRVLVNDFVLHVKIFLVVELDASLKETIIQSLF